MSWTIFIAAVHKAIEWAKANWKWIIFPVGIATVIIGVLSSRSRTPEPLPDIGGDSLQLAEKLTAIAVERDIKLKELKDANQARLQELSEDQHKELEDLRHKSIEEIAEWFNKL